jgi:DNA-binding CsgD family transcriptional regulator
MTAQPFVGRQEEFQRLRDAFDDARAGRGGLVMITGEPGIGKTRLARELESYAAEHGARVIWGRAHEAGGAPAYWPWVQALRQLAETADGEELRGWLGGGASEVARIVPDLRERLPDLPAPEPIVDPQSAQFRLFDATTSFIQNAASMTPLVVVLDDLHWADRSTLLLLEHAALELPRANLLLVGTYRDVELGRQHPLEEALAGIGRAERFQTIDLRGLSEEDVAAYVRATTGVEPSAEAMRSVYRETEGNAFFLQEVVAQMAREGTLESGEVSVPPSVRAAIGRRLSVLSEECNELLRTAAVVGREFSEALLARLSDAGGDQLPELLETALGGGVVQETGRPGECRFAHALIQETLLEEVRASQRVRLHGRIARALEELHGDRAVDQAAELAHHFAESAVLDRTHATKALGYSQAAGQQAERETAWEEAAAHYRRAVALVRDAGDELAEPEPQLLTALGRCYRNAAQHDEAWRALTQAIDIYRDREDGRGFARAVVETLETHAGEDQLLPLEDEALLLLAGADAHLEAQLSIQRARWGWGDAEERAAQRAEEMARSHGFADVEAFLFDRESHRAWEEQQFDEAQHAARLAHEAFDLLGNHALASHHLYDAAIGHVFAGELDAAEAAGGEALEYARRYGNSFYEQSALFAMIVPPLLRCDFGRVDALLREFDEVAGDHFIPRMVRAGRLEAAGSVEPAVAMLAEHPGDAGVPPEFVVAVLGARARARFSAGDERGAHNELAAWASAFQTNTVAAFYRWIALAEVDGGLSALGDDDLVASAYREVSTWEAVKLAGFAPGGLDRIRGTLALRLGKAEDAERWFQLGLEWAEQQSCPVEAGRCHQGLAEVAEHHGRWAEALAHLEAAAALFERHGAKLYLDQVHARREELEGASAASRQRRPDGLTPREIEVLRLVAAGRSSREIAEGLVLSVRTVERHIANIYTKTDSNGRAQATAYALTNGLV